MITLFDNFKCNKEAAGTFKEKLEHTVIVLYHPEEGLVKLAGNDKSELLRYHIKQLETILIEAKNYFDVFTKASFLSALLRGKEPQRKFEEYDKAIQDSLNSLSLAIQMKIARS